MEVKMKENDNRSSTRKSDVHASDYDMINNMTTKTSNTQSNPIMKDRESLSRAIEKTSSNSPLTNVISTIFGVLFFTLLASVGKYFAKTSTYNSFSDLVGVLAVSCI